MTGEVLLQSVEAQSDLSLPTSPIGKHQGGQDAAVADDSGPQALAVAQSELIDFPTVRQLAEGSMLQVHGVSPFL